MMHKPLVLVSTNKNPDSIEFIKLWQAVGIAQRQYFDKYGDIETSMMDNSPPGGDDDYDGGVLSDNIRKAVLAITRDKEETSNKLIALCDYALNDDQKLIVYSPLPSIDPLYQDTASFVEGIKTTIYSHLN